MADLQLTHGASEEEDEQPNPTLIGCAGSAKSAPQDRDSFLKFLKQNRRSGYYNITLPDTPITLKNPIHPIFAGRNWSFGRKKRQHSDLWNKLNPALRLATRFITERKIMSRWVRLLHGRKKFDPVRNI